VAPIIKGVIESQSFLKCNATFLNEIVRTSSKSAFKLFCPLQFANVVTGDRRYEHPTTVIYERK
jgi:hypothetical protein